MARGIAAFFMAFRELVSDGLLGSLLLIVLGLVAAVVIFSFVAYVTSRFAARTAEELLGLLAVASALAIVGAAIMVLGFLPTARLIATLVALLICRALIDGWLRQDQPFSKALAAAITLLALAIAVIYVLARLTGITDGVWIALAGAVLAAFSGYVIGIRRRASTLNVLWISAAVLAILIAALQWTLFPHHALADVVTSWEAVSVSVVSLAVGAFLGLLRNRTNFVG